MLIYVFRKALALTQITRKIHTSTSLLKEHLVKKSQISPSSKSHNVDYNYQSHMVYQRNTTYFGHGIQVILPIEEVIMSIVKSMVRRLLT